MKRFIEKLKDPKDRKFFCTILGGKFLGIGGLFLLYSVVKVYLGGGPAMADDAAAVPAYVNPINTVWTLVTAFLVFFMQAGFMMLEAGFARSRETVNVLLEGVID